MGLTQSSHIRLSEGEIMNRREIIRCVQKGDIKGLSNLNNLKGFHFNNPAYHDEMGRNVLHHVLESPHFKSRDIRDLISWGIDINKKDINGKLPIHIAVQNHNIPAIKVLLDASNENIQEELILEKNNHTKTKSNLRFVKQSLDQTTRNLDAERTAHKYTTDKYETEKKDHNKTKSILGKRNRELSTCQEHNKVLIVENVQLKKDNTVLEQTVKSQRGHFKKK